MILKTAGGSTVIVKVAVAAHWPVAGVKVYVVVVLLLSAGDHVPAILFRDVVGSGAKTVPAQMGATPLNAGVMLELTVMVNVVVVAHCPAVGVKV